jgi:hypothetical protein
MESRVQKTLLNARVNLIFYFLTLCLSFFSRKIFLDCLGADFVGLTGTLQNLLGFLNLAELGVGSAIGYLLYKPLFDKDHDKINEIISVMGYLYRWIGGIILGAGCVLACFLPLIFPETGFDLALIYFAYFAFLGSSMIGYFINYRQNLLGADQRNYVVAGYFQSMNICKVIVQLVLAYYTRNYYLWVLIELSFGIIYSFVLNWKINRTYPWLRTEVSRGKELLKVHRIVLVKTRQLFIQKISSFVQYQTVPFLTYAFVNLQTVAFYGNYTIIAEKLAWFVNAFLESSGASIGNLIAEGNRKKIVDLFWELICMRYFIGGVFTFATYSLIEPFITIWLGDEYILSTTILFLICLNYFIGYTRGGVMQFLFGYGLFQDVWAPISEIVINLSVAISCGFLWGLEGVLLGVIVSQLLIVGIWKPIFLFRKGFGIPVWLYWIRMSLIASELLIPAIFMNIFVIPNLSIDPSLGYISWIQYSVIIVALYSMCAFTLLYCSISQMRTFVRRFI